MNFSAPRVKASHRARLRTYGVLFVAAALLKPAEAKAAGMAMNCDGGCAGLLLLMMTAPVVLVSADGYYTVQAFRGEPQVTRQSARNTIYWTSWQVPLLDGIALASFASINEDESDNDIGMGFLALGTWPLSLTAHGMWHAFPDSSVTRGIAVGMVTASDVGLLSYDAWLLSKARRPGVGLALAESFIGTLQLGFGVITAFRAAPHDRAAVWSMTAIPAALTTHGILSLALPEAQGSPRDSRSPTSTESPRLPRLGLSPLPDGFTMQAVGTF